MKKLFLSVALVLAPLLSGIGAEFTNITKAIAGDLRSTSANAYSLVQTNGTAVIRASLEQMRNRMLSEPANGLNLTNVQGTNVFGFVQNATNAINATNLWGTLTTAQVTNALGGAPILTNAINTSGTVAAGTIEASTFNVGTLVVTNPPNLNGLNITNVQGTNIDGTVASATTANYATNLVSGASTTNLLLSGIGVADTNWVLQQISSLGSVHYLTGVTNTGSFTNSGETLPRTNNYITWLTVPTTVTTQSFGGLAVNAYIRHNVTTNTYAVISAGPASVSSYCYRTGAGTVSGHYEIYAYDTVSNLLYELASSSPVTIATGATPTRYDWQMTVPTSFVATNATKMVIAFKLDQIGSGGPVLSFVNGGNYDAHFTFSRPLSTAKIDGSQISGNVANAILVTSNAPVTWLTTWDVTTGATLLVTNMAADFSMSIGAATSGYETFSSLSVSNGAGTTYGITFAGCRGPGGVSQPKIYCTNAVVTDFTVHIRNGTFTNVIGTTF